MLIDDITNTCTMSNVTVGAELLSLQAFIQSDIPALCINLPAMTVFAVIAADGSTALIENGQVTQEFDGCVVEGDDILRDAAAQLFVRDLAASEMSAQLSTLGAASSNHCLLAATVGARRHLGVSQHTSLEELADAARKAGGDADRINGALDAFGNELDEPLFIPDEVVGWNAEARDELETLLTDALNSDPRYEGCWFELLSATEDEPAQLDVDAAEGHSISSRAIAILNRLVDLEQDFQGHSYEYSDGAAARRSGYTYTPARIIAGDLDPVSNHERLRALERLQARLIAKGVKTEEIDGLFRT